MFQSFVKPGAEPGVHPEPQGHQLMCGCGHLEKGLLGSLLVRLVRGGREGRFLLLLFFLFSGSVELLFMILTVLSRHL